MSNRALRIVNDQEKKESCCSVAFNVSESESSLPTNEYQGNAAIVTLGCAKNQVDSEVMLGVLRKSGFSIVSDVRQAEVVIVNTCGFLESSVKESIDAIIDVGELKHSGRLRKLIVAGCMVERYGKDVAKNFPEVDAFIGTDDLLKVAEVVGDDNRESKLSHILNKASRPYFLYDDKMPRQLSTRSHMAYVKVSEGCDRPCTFCVIPRIRGAMRSRSISSIVSEARSLGEVGVKEINLVAQDLTSFGKDLGLKNGLQSLLQELDQVKAVPWIRLLYAYPIGIDRELLLNIQELRTICNYLDLPLQHSSQDVLKLMQRPIGRYAARNIIEFIKKETPDIKLRTTFIVGFPGETEKDIQDLENFVSEGHFSSVGVFTYSKEEGTPSYDLEGHISEDEKFSRRERIMLAQKRSLDVRLTDLIGKTLDVLIEGAHEDTDMLLTGRTEFQAPEVDSCVIVNDLSVVEGDSDDKLEIGGTIRKVEITEIAGYDLVGKLID